MTDRIGKGRSVIPAGLYNIVDTSTTDDTRRDYFGTLRLTVFETPYAFKERGGRIMDMETQVRQALARDHEYIGQRTRNI